MDSATAALNGGYHVVFLIAAILAATAGMLGGVLLRRGRPGAQSDVERYSPTTADVD